ncbi:MAG TPA: hypothetical protein VHZ07_26510 [Bryobacteraceae bacterium]|jgi:pyruvate/2-oxoglutarate dehydrogenase complex dihydrolipoamide dehydrogenase (E3) component|nr:hypothetical protein [Bryobacteraceae bacterium]
MNQPHKGDELHEYSRKYDVRVLGGGTGGKLMATAPNARSPYFTQVSEHDFNMGTVQFAMLAGLPYTMLRDSVFAHPTMTEGPYS